MALAFKLVFKKDITNNNNNKIFMVFKKDLRTYISLFFLFKRSLLFLLNLFQVETFLFKSLKTEK